MDERMTNQLSPSTGSNTSAVPFGPVLSNEAKKPETVANVDAGTRNAGSSSTSTTTAEQYDERRIYVSNIPFSFRSPDLIQMFTPFGVVSNAEIVMNERGSKGFGFVTLDTKEGCDAARAALNGLVVQGRVIEVKRATTAPYRRNSARGQHSSALPQTTIPLPPRADFLAGQLPQIPAQPLITHNVSDPLSALILAQNQLRLQSMINPLAVREPSLLYPRPLPLQQQATLMGGGVPLPSLALSPIPVQLLCASRGTENLPPTGALTATMMPLTTAGLTYASLPAVNPSNVLVPPAVPCRLSQDATSEAFPNFFCDPGFFKSPPPVSPYTGGLDLVGSLGLAAGIPTPFQPNTNAMKEKFRTSGLRAFDQSCVIDTSFHGEPLKEGQYGPIGRAVPSGGINNQVNSTNNEFRSQSSMALEENVSECSAGQSGGNNPNLLPVYHPFEPPTDRNGRKRLSSLDSYHLSKKQAKSI